MRLTVFILTLFFATTGIHAQRIIQPKLIEVDFKGIIYKKEWAVDLRIHENGASIAYNSGTIKTYNKTNYYHLELGFTKDPREKGQNKISPIARSGSFAFGKQNNLINIRAGVGTKRYLSEKAKRKGLAVGYTFEVGPSIALLKPYYLDLIYITEEDGRISTEIRSEKYTAENADRFLDFNFINGKSSYWKGFDEINVTAGIQGKIGAHFALGAFDKYVKAFETGVMFDAFYRNIPIMVATDEVSNKPFFIKLYINAHLGIRSHN